MPVITLTPVNSVVDDARVIQNAPTQNYNDTSIRLGYNSGVTSPLERGLIKFDLGLIPNDAIINSATLQLYAWDTVAFGITLNKITSAWLESSVSWNNQPPSTIVSTDSSGTTANSYKSFDIKSIVQQWVSGDPNHGILLKALLEDSRSGLINFASSKDTTARQPRLTIDYTIPTTGKKQVEWVGRMPSSVTGTSAAITLPTFQAGDMFVAMVVANSSTATVLAPSGWITLVNQVNNGRRYVFATRTAQSGDTSPVFTSNESVGWGGVIQSFRNVKSIARSSFLAISNTTVFDVGTINPVTMDNTLMVTMNVTGNLGGSFSPSLSFEEKFDETANSAVFQMSQRYMHTNRGSGVDKYSIYGGTASGYAGLLMFEPKTNNPPTLTLTSLANNLSLAEGSTYKLEGTVSDADAGNVLSVKYSIGGGPTQNIALGTSDGSTPLSFSKTLTYSQGRFWDGATDVSGLLPAEAASIQIWAHDGIDDSAKVARSFTIQQEDGKLYVPVNVVSQSYLVSRMAPPVRLSNGWMIGLAYSTTPVTYVYKSADNGKSWSQLCFISSTPTTGYGPNALAAKGTNVYIIGARSSALLSLWRFDAATQTNIDIEATRINIDSGQTSVGANSLAITPDGTKLWWAASTKNSNLPNSYNIRAGSIPINGDGTLGTPSATSQVTTANTASDNRVSPVLLFKADGNPLVVFVRSDTTNTFNRLEGYGFDGTLWAYVAYPYYAGSGVSYVPSNPVGCKTPDGKMHLVFHTKDSLDTVSDYVIHAKSSNNGTSWTSRKLVKGQNASITSDKTGKLTITYEDGGYIKRIESTNEFTSYQGPFVVGAGTVPASFYDPTFSTDFSAPPTFFQAAGAVKYYGVLNLNKKPVVTLDTPDNQTLTEQETLAVSGSTLDEDTDNVITTKYKINNGPTRALASGISDGSTPISFARALTYSGKRVWDGAVDVAGADLAENVDHYLIVWAEDDKGGKSVEVTRKFRVVWNRPPVIGGENGDIGIHETAPNVTYSVMDPEGNPFTVVEKIDGVELRSFAGVDGREETFEIEHDTWLRLEPGIQHMLTIEATDSNNLKSIRTYTFTRFEDQLSFEIEVPWTTDVSAKRVLLTLDMNFPPGLELVAEATNNAFDAEPVWEDISFNARYGRGYVFQNNQKMAAEWGVSIRVQIEKGTATEPIIIKGFGGAFD